MKKSTSLYIFDHSDHTYISAKDIQPDKIVCIDLFNTEIGIFFSVEGADLYMHVVHGWEDDYFKKTFDVNTQALAFNAEKDGCTEHIGVIFPYVPDGGLLAHECMHLVDYVCEVIGIPMTPDTGEPRGYMLQYLFDEITDAIEEWTQENPEWPKS